MFKENEVKTHFIRYVTKHMNEKEIRPWYVAYYSEISDSTFRKYIKGIQLPKPVTLIFIAELFECTVNDLLGYEGNDTYKQVRRFDSGLETRKVARQFANQVRDRIIAKHWDITELAYQSLTTHYSIYRYLTEPFLPDTYTLIRLCDALDCTPSDLLGY